MRNCECCHASYSTGREYGDKWCILPLNVETKGLCEMCNPKTTMFCCHKHGIEYKIGHITYQPA